jgi:23S rRNA (guanosine2251-2'-O)-methyltransferase
VGSTKIFGINAIRSRLQLGRTGVEKIMLRDGDLSARLQEILDLAVAMKCPVDRVSEEVLAKLTDVAHQGVGMMLLAPELKSEADLFEIIENRAGDLLFLVLDGVTDPRNLGACLRSAATFGVHAVIVPKDNSAPLNDAAVKTASGGASCVLLVQVVNLSRCLNRMQKENIWIVGTLLDARQSIVDVDMTGNIAIVLGSEGKGLRRNTIKCCDFLARIPMVNDNFGLNVSVATGICLYEINRQRVK